MIKTYLIFFNIVSYEGDKSCTDYLVNHFQNRCIKQSDNSVIVFQNDSLHLGTEAVEMNAIDILSKKKKEVCKDVFVYEVKMEEVIMRNPNQRREIEHIVKKLKSGNEFKE